MVFPSNTYLADVSICSVQPIKVISRIAAVKSLFIGKNFVVSYSFPLQIYNFLRYNTRFSHIIYMYIAQKIITLHS